MIAKKQSSRINRVGFALLFRKYRPEIAATMTHAATITPITPLAVGGMLKLVQFSQRLEDNAITLNLTGPFGAKSIKISHSSAVGKDAYTLTY